MNCKLLANIHRLRPPPPLITKFTEKVKDVNNISELHEYTSQIVESVKMKLKKDNNYSFGR